MSALRFRTAINGRDLAQIHALNHQIFAEELGQRSRDPSGLLIDHLDSQNTYFVAARGELVIGMVAVSAGPEFSIAKRISDKAVLGAFPRPLEVRLLAIAARERGHAAIAGLFWQVYHFARSRGHSHLLASAISSKERMYRKLGFRPLGRAISEGHANFIPMALSMDEQTVNSADRIRRYKRWSDRSAMKAAPISLMPGPVAIHPRVRRAYCAVPISHRSELFVDAFEKTRSNLAKLAIGSDVALLPGGGTLANDAVAANLRAIFGKARGLVISNGEFGERLGLHAVRGGLSFEALSFSWCEPWSFREIAAALDRKPAWVWAVHLETSTGVLNDGATLLRMADHTQTPVALDCVSSVGAVAIPSEMGRLYLATGVSGKSLGSYAGLGFVFISGECRELLAGKQLNSSFDLLRMLDCEGPVSTIPSSVLLALSRALADGYGSTEALVERFQHNCILGKTVRQQMRLAGMAPLAPEEYAAPNIASFCLPTQDFPERCLRAGYKIAHESGYLRRRGWGQIATMGDLKTATIEKLFRALR